MKHGIVLSLLLLVLLGIGRAVAAEEETQGTGTDIVLHADPKSEYLFRPGSSAGELLLKLSYYPANLLDQIRHQFSPHLVSARVLDRGDSVIIVALYIEPASFKYSHVFDDKTGTLVLTILPDSVEVASNGLPIVPLMPMWEALADESDMLPPAPYDEVTGQGQAFEAFRTNAQLVSVGAFDAAIKRLKESITKGEGPIWAASLTLYGEAVFGLAKQHGDDFASVIKALVIAEHEAPTPGLKARAQLLLAMANARAGLSVEAGRGFAQGADLYPDLKPYFLFGALDMALEQRHEEAAQDVLRDLEKAEGLDRAMQRKLCVAKALFIGRQGRVLAANEQIDTCLVGAMGGDLTPSQRLALGELRALNARFTEAKDAFSHVLRDNADFRLAPLAAMRLGDIAAQERKWEDAARLYAQVSRGNPDSPYGRLAELKGLEIRNALRGAPMDIYKAVDVLHEPWPIGREVMLKRLWNAFTTGQVEDAYTLYRELLRRYDGIYYWAFAAPKLTRLVMGRLEDLTLKSDYLGIIDFYNRMQDFPLAPEEVQTVVLAAAEAYRELDHPEQVVRVLKEAMNRPGRLLPDERSMLVLLAEAYIAMGDELHTRQTTDYYHGRFGDPADVAQYHVILSELEEKRGQPEAAQSALYFAMQAAPDNATQRTLAAKIGRIAYNHKNYPDAARYLNRAVEPLLGETYVAADLGSENRHALFLLADSYYNQKMYDECLATYRRLLTLFPGERMANLARYYAADSAIKAGYPATAQAFLSQLSDNGDEFWKKIGTLKSEIAAWYQKQNLPMP